jgi:hypothetical protein
MKAILGLLTTFLVVHLGVIASGIGIGLLCAGCCPRSIWERYPHRVVSMGLSIYYFLRICLSGGARLPRWEDDDFRPPIIVTRKSLPRSGRKRKRK